VSISFLGSFLKIELKNTQLPHWASSNAVVAFYSQRVDLASELITVGFSSVILRFLGAHLDIALSVLSLYIVLGTLVDTDSGGLRSATWDKTPLARFKTITYVHALYPHPCLCTVPFSQRVQATSHRVNPTQKWILPARISKEPKSFEW
jgi:hypothetical protein